MTRMYKLLFMVVIVSAWSKLLKAQVSLSQGTHGRVEYTYNGQLGTVCDDNWNDVDCQVVCRELNLQGGIVVPNAANTYGQGTGVIWMDEVNCMGNENSLNQCQRNHWGVTDCTHIEDAGCQCGITGGVATTAATAPPGGTIPSTNSPTAGTTRAPLAASTCTKANHRLVEFDATNFPNIGRVELLDGGVWKGICDDFWDDIGAAVFCNCLGQANAQNARAYWTQNATSLSRIALQFDSVRCKTTDNGDLSACTTTPAAGKCTDEEAAFVACQPVPGTVSPPAPNATMTCESIGKATVCFTSDMMVIKQTNLKIMPNCAQAVARTVTKGLCLDIDMVNCAASKTETNTTLKSYCYNVTYNDTVGGGMFASTEGIWSRQACCHIMKNGSAISQFQPLLPGAHSPVSANTNPDFNMDCFLNAQFSGTPLMFPARVTRGQDVYCRVSSVNTWDPNMYLVVPDCTARATVGGTPQYQFIKDKCPIQGVFDIDVFSINNWQWGFRLSLPQFQNQQMIYLECDAYNCDTQKDSKPYCDRTCLTGTTGKKRRKRAARVYPGRGHGNEEDKDEGNGIVTRGPFEVEDTGFGPLILSNGQCVLVLPNGNMKQSRLNSSIESAASLSQHSGTTLRNAASGILSYSLFTLLPLTAAQILGYLGNMV